MLCRADLGSEQGINVQKLSDLYGCMLVGDNVNDIDTEYPVHRHTVYYTDTLTVITCYFFVKKSLN